MLDEGRVRQAVQQVIAAKPRGYFAILSHFQRLVKLDLDRRTARVQSAVPLAEPQQASIRANLARRYGEGLIFDFTQNPASSAACGCRSAATFLTAACRPGWPSWKPVSRTLLQFDKQL